MTHGEVPLFFGRREMRSGGWLDLATRRLAEALCRSWSHEMAMRELHSTPPLIVRWAITDSPIEVPSWTNPDHDDSPGRTVPISLRGTVGEMDATFRMLQSRQLVVLGEAGSGKTIATMMLTLGLLEDPKLTEPVPFPVLIASWRPVVQRLDSMPGQGLRAGRVCVARHSGQGLAAQGFLPAQGVPACPPAPGAVPRARGAAGQCVLGSPGVGVFDAVSRRWR
jgi:hypothetical protein